MFIFVSIIVCACSTTKKTSKPAAVSTENSVDTTTTIMEDGSSFQNAIVIHEKSETKGIDKEYEWLRKNYPGYQFQGQSLNQYKGKPYDILKIKTADGTQKSVYFNISNFFGKL